jgi:hypothetical protein
VGVEEGEGGVPGTVGRASSTGAGAWPDGGEAQAASKLMMAAAALRARAFMWVILLEALGALLILVFIVWWTLFSGRRGGERSDED